MTEKLKELYLFWRRKLLSEPPSHSFCLRLDSLWYCQLDLGAPELRTDPLDLWSVTQHYRQAIVQHLADLLYHGCFCTQACVYVCVCLCVLVCSSGLLSNHQVSQATEAHMASPQRHPEAWDCWVSENWCVCGVGARVFLCVREYTTGRKTGETRAFCHHSHTQRIGFLPGRREWVKGARLKKKRKSSISWKSFSCRLGAGCMWCWLEWKYAGSTVKISVDSSHQRLKLVIAFAISISRGGQIAQ